ncbi:MAG: cation:proton antiporter [bacterium]|nr:cation:proton antiporter [bacterium]
MRWIRLGVGTMAAALVLAGCASTRLPGWLGGDANPADGQVYYAAVDGLAVYADPAGTSPVVGRLPLHARVLRTELRHGYAHVVADRDGLDGWVDGRQLVWRLPAAGAAPPGRASAAHGTYPRPRPHLHRRPTPRPARTPCGRAARPGATHPDRHAVDGAAAARAAAHDLRPLLSVAETHPHALLVVLLVAAVAPLFNELPIRLRLPLVVLELVFGIVVGPQVLDLVANEGILRALAALGLSFLFFLAGMDLDFHELRGRPLQLGLAGWAASLALALGLTHALRLAGVVSDQVLVAIALGTTAIGTLLPILRDAGELGTPFGRFVLGAGALGEFGPILLFSLVITGDDGVAVRSGLMATFVFIALACAAVALRLGPPLKVGLFARTLQSTSQLPIRLSMFLLGGLVVLADLLGLDILLGAFAAGSVVGLLARGPGAGPFRQKLDALGFGFLIPIFFVVSGTQVDLRALFASSESLVRVPLFLALLLVVRGLPALLYRRELGARERLVLALFSATSLPLIVVIAELGKATGRMLPENAAALVGAGILSVLIFPLAALSLRTPLRPPVA